MSGAERLRRKRPGRSFWLKILAAGLLILSVSGWLRLQQALAGWRDLTEIGIQPGPLYIAVTGGLIGAGGLVAALSVWLRSRRGFQFTRVFALIWQAWAWADRLWVSSAENAAAGWPFALGATALILIFIFAVLDEEGRQWHENERSRNRG